MVWKLDVTWSTWWKPKRLVPPVGCGWATKPGKIGA